MRPSVAAVAGSLVAAVVAASGCAVVAPIRAETTPAVTPLSRAEAKLRPVLRTGSRGLWVRRLHRALHIVPARQPFAATTSRAVVTFRLAHGLSPKPVVTTRTWMVLGSSVVVGRRLPAPTDITVTPLARTSREYRATVGVQRFATSATARTVVSRESGGQCGVSDPSGTYRGKWQMDAAFWSTYGGRQFATRPDLATCAQQDLVAYRGWVDRWWQPWSTAAW
jgi:Transglycosylase-like domain